MFGDPGIVMLLAVAPAIVAAYLLAKGHVAAGAATLALWVPLFWLFAGALERRAKVRRWITLAGGTAVFAVSIAVFAWLPTP